MDVAAGHRVTDAEELIAALGIADDLLRPQVEQRLLVDLPRFDEPATKAK